MHSQKPNNHNISDNGGCHARRASLGWEGWGRGPQDPKRHLLTLYISDRALGQGYSDCSRPTRRSWNQFLGSWPAFNKNETQEDRREINSITLCISVMYVHTRLWCKMHFFLSVVVEKFESHYSQCMELEFMRFPLGVCENHFPWGFLGLSLEALAMSLSGGTLVCQICLIWRWQEGQEGGRREGQARWGLCESEEEGRAPEPVLIPWVC